MLFGYAPNNLALSGRVMEDPQMPFHAPLMRNRRRKRDRPGKGGCFTGIQPGPRRSAAANPFARCLLYQKLRTNQRPNIGS
jgi:hypothetical protein